MQFLLLPLNYLISLFLNGLPQPIVVGVVIFVLVAIINIILELL